MLCFYEPAAKIILSGLESICLIVSEVHAICDIVAGEGWWHAFNHVPVMLWMLVLLWHLFLRSNQNLSINCFSLAMTTWPELLSLISVLRVHPEVVRRFYSSRLNSVVKELRNVLWRRDRLIHLESWDCLLDEFTRKHLDFLWWHLPHPFLYICKGNSGSSQWVLPGLLFLVFWSWSSFFHFHLFSWCDHSIYLFDAILLLLFPLLKSLVRVDLG